MSGLMEAARSHGTRTVVVRGKGVVVRVLNAHEALSIKEALPPKPVPPMVHTPNMGSLAPHVPDERDPKYLKETDRWFTLHACALIAVAAGVEVDGEKWSEKSSSDWVCKAADLLARSLSEIEINQLWAATRGEGSQGPQDEPVRPTQA